MTTLTARELHDRLAAGENLCVLDVLPAEHFSAVHVPGARNACVYEVSFLEQVRAAGAEGRPVVVYGAGLGTRETAVAAEKLTAAGFAAVIECPEGLAGWEAAGLPLERGPANAEPAAEGDFRVDAARSVVRWTGRNLFNHHEGTVRLEGGEFFFEEGRLVRGEVRVDLRTIACDDLPPGPAAGLIRHLQDADFFDVERYPVARFAFTAEPLVDAPAGSPNVRLRGDFSLRGATRELEFAAVVAPKGAEEVIGQAQIAIDRTLWGAIYGSGKFFSFLGPHVVNDLVDLHLKVFAVRVPA